jgi:hypothetical protein
LLSGIGGGGRQVKVGSYPDELASGDKDKEPFGSAGGDEVIAHLLAIEVCLLDTGIDVRFPVNDEVNQSNRLICV